MKNTYFHVFAFLLSLWSGAVWCVVEEVQKQTNQSNAADKSYYFGFDGGSKKSGHSVAPVIGYDPTYKFVVGAAYFFDGPKLSYGVDGNLNFNGVFQAHARAAYDFLDVWDLQWRFGAIRGFEGYYGDGGQTRVEDLQQLWGDRLTTTLHLHRRMSDYFTLGVLVDLRSRTEEQGRNPTFNRVAPDQVIAAVGLTTQFDSRKPGASRPDDGVVLTTALSHSPTAFSSLGGAPFTQLESSLVVYKEVLADMLPGVVAAFRVMGGISDGDVPFAFRYRLGGAEKMRGYWDNRFRGRKYYLQQTELRAPIWKMIGAAASLGFGDITDTEFTFPKMAYGVGLRIGLPPDYVSQIRIDAGFARDQTGIFAEFGQTF